MRAGVTLPVTFSSVERPVARMAPLERPLEDDVSAAARGDRGAFGRLVDRTRVLVSSIALACTRDPATSEDLAQEVYLEAWRTLPRLRAPSRFVPWISAMARHRATDDARSRARRPASDSRAVDAAVDTAPAVLDALIRAEDTRRIALALEDLAPEDREVLVLSIEADMPVDLKFDFAASDKPAAGEAEAVDDLAVPN
jgi:RNA polymerase sigma factor (sigma-70 family)